MTPEERKVWREEYRRHEATKQNVYVAYHRQITHDSDYNFFLIGVFTTPERAILACVHYFNSEYDGSKIDTSSFETIIDDGQEILWECDFADYGDSLIVAKERLDANTYLTAEHRV